MGYTPHPQTIPSFFMGTGWSTNGHRPSDRFTGRLASVLGLDESGNPAEFGATAWNILKFSLLWKSFESTVWTYPYLSSSNPEHGPNAWKSRGSWSVLLWNMGRFRTDFSIIQFPSLICVPLRLSQDTKQMYTVYLLQKCMYTLPCTFTCLYLFSVVFTCNHIHPYAVAFFF